MSTNRELREYHVKEARRLVDWFDGRPMPRDVADRVEHHLDTAKALETHEAADRAPVYVHDMTGGTAGKVYSGDGRLMSSKTSARDQYLTKDQSVTDWLIAKGAIPADSREYDLARYLRGIATGEWQDADGERELFVKANAEGTASAGGNLVPTPLSAQLIDLARKASVVFRAGAQTVPMTSMTLKVPKLTGEGTPGWRNENAAITDSDMTFDAVTFQARSLNRLVKLSVELFEDSDPSAGSVIANSFAAQIALEIDRAALRGTGTAPEPRGVLNQSGITTTSHGANGTAISNYDWLLDSIGAVRANNFEPIAHIVAPRSMTSFSKLKEATTNSYLAPPSGLLPMLPTNQVPTNLTVGTSTDCSEFYTADWRGLLVGVRTQLRVELLRERYADNGQYGFLAWFRGDVQLAQPGAFAVDLGVRA